jgi:DNA-binding NarL/FixJ family response regulator
VPVESVRVLVVYSHPLFGEGLAGMLASEPSIEVGSVNVEKPDALAAALAANPEVIVVEEGGSIEVTEILRRTRCPMVVTVDIGSADAWTFRRSTIRSRPDEVIQTILGAIRSDPPPDDDPDHPSPVGRVRPAALTG